MTARENLLKSIMAVRFYAWDLHLYLDTHPCDETATELLKKYQERNKELTKEYECQFGPLSPMTGHGKEWTKAPWPWQKAGDC